MGSELISPLLSLYPLVSQMLNGGFSGSLELELSRVPNFKDKKEIRWANYGEIEQTVGHTELVQDWVQ